MILSRDSVAAPLVALAFVASATTATSTSIIFHNAGRQIGNWTLYDDSIDVAAVEAADEEAEVAMEPNVEQALAMTSKSRVFATLGISAFILALSLSVAKSLDVIHAQSSISALVIVSGLALARASALVRVGR